MVRFIRGAGRFLGLLIAAILLWSVVSCVFPPSHVASAKLDGTTTLTLVAYPLGGFHSDWRRGYEISDGQSTVTIDAFEDTGWWRGSALFRDETGAYFIDDGIDYFFFSVCPPEVLERLPATPLSACEGSGLLDGIASHRETPSPNLTYLGTFYERPSIAFHSWEIYPEPSRDDLDAGG